MDRKFKRINMDDVKSIINQKGFYYFSLERVYDIFEGSKYIIVTDNPDHIKQNPQYADEIIMTTEQFESYAEVFNTFLANEDRERKRQLCHIEYTENSEMDLSAYMRRKNPVEDKVIANLEKEHIEKALKQLTETQCRRFELFFFYGWTERQIAEYEGVNRYAVRTSLNSAIKKLKKIL